MKRVGLILFLGLSLGFTGKSQEFCADSLKFKQLNDNMYCFYSIKNDTINGAYKIVLQDSVIESGFIKMGYKNGFCKKSIGDNRVLIEEYLMGQLKSAKFYNEGKIYYEEIYNNIHLEYSVIYHEHSSDTGSSVINKLAWKGYVKNIEDLK